MSSSLRTFSSYYVNGGASPARRDGCAPVSPGCFPYRGQHMSPRQLHRLVCFAAARAGITKRVGVHALRRSFVTHLQRRRPLWGFGIRQDQCIEREAELETGAGPVRRAYRNGGIGAEPMVCRLSPGGSRIRTSSPACGKAAFRHASQHHNRLTLMAAFLAAFADHRGQVAFIACHPQGQDIARDH
jgi:hypothetical protein